MAHEEAEIVRQHSTFKERDHVPTDGTRRGGNCQAALALQITRRTTEIVRQHLRFKERNRVLPDGTRRGRNREVGGHLAEKPSCPGAVLDVGNSTSNRLGES